MKKLISTIIAILLLVSCFTTAFASTVRITGEHVNVRRTPSLNGEIIYEVRKGDEFEYWGDTSTDDRGVAWYHIIYGNISAWVSSANAELIDDGYGDLPMDPGELVRAGLPFQDFWSDPMHVIYCAGDIEIQSATSEADSITLVYGWADDPDGTPSIEYTIYYSESKDALTHCVEGDSIHWPGEYQSVTVDHLQAGKTYYFWVVTWWPDGGYRMSDMFGMACAGD